MNENKKKWYEKLVDCLIGLCGKLFELFLRFLAFVLAVVVGIASYVKLDKNGAFDEVNLSSTLISASADEATPVAETADVESGIDSTLYPSANLIYFPFWENSKTKSGLTFTNNADGTVTVNGTATGTAIYIIRNFDLILPAGEYVLSGASGGQLGSGSYHIQIATANYSKAWNGVDATQFTLEKEETLLVQIVVYEGQTLENYVFKPMINRGKVAYPFIPNLDGVYNQGYQTGEESGYNNGYDEGVLDGEQLAQYGFFYGATAEFSYTDNSGNAQIVHYPVSYVNSGINFSGLVASLKSLAVSKQPDFSKSCSLLVILSPSVYAPVFRASGLSVYSSFYDVLSNRDYNCSLYYNNSSTATSGFNGIVAPTLTDLGNSNYRFDFDFSDTVNAPTASTGYFRLIRLVNGSVGFSFDYLSNMILYTMGNSYQAGYNEGFSAGLNDTSEYDEGYNNGYTSGKSDGYNEGLSKGLSSDPFGFGDFIYTALDMPGRLLSNLLNFEFLGVNLAGLVTVILSIFLVAWVLKKIKKL